MKELEAQLADLGSVTSMLSNADELLRLAFRNLVDTVDNLIGDIYGLAAVISRHLEVLRPYFRGGTYTTDYEKTYLEIGVDGRKISWQLDFDEDEKVDYIYIGLVSEGVKTLRLKLGEMAKEPLAYGKLAVAARSYKDYRQRFNGELLTFKRCLGSLLQKERDRYDHLVGMAKAEKWVLD